MAKQRGIKLNIPNNLIVDATKSEADRRRVGRIIKNDNFMRGSKYLHNGEKANQYRYKRKEETLTV